MIYTLTLNPSLDYVLTADNLSSNDINRARTAEFFFGGKGINVSYVLTQLGVPTTTLGFVGGFTGEKLCLMLNEAGINNDFVFLTDGDTRINVKLRHNIEPNVSMIDISELDINAPGPEIPKNKLEELIKKFDAVKDTDCIVLAGSVPPSVPDTIYGDILERLSDKNMSVAVDATGRLLLNTLEHHPFLIKPNHHELGEIFGKKLTDTEEIITYAKELQHMGARNVLVSRGENGAVLADENGEIHIAKAVNGNVKNSGIPMNSGIITNFGIPINSTGCGDSMVAGFLSAYLESKDYSHALKISIAVSAATAFSTGLADREAIEKILHQYMSNINLRF